VADWLAAIILGVVEGLTEFIPVSSTGHLLLTKEALGLQDQPWDTFIVMIQLGAILAVVAVYFMRLWKVLLGLPGKDPSARRFAISVLLAFFPSALLGLLAHDFIKEVLFNTTIVCVMLIVGGFALIALERWSDASTGGLRRRVRNGVEVIEQRELTTDAMRFSWKTALCVGLWQCLSIIPGVSRSGATIVGGLLLLIGFVVVVTLVLAGELLPQRQAAGAPVAKLSTPTEATAPVPAVDASKLQASLAGSLPLDPLARDAALGRAERAIGEGRRADARVAYEDAVAADPTAPAALIGLGTLAMQQRDWVVARDCFEKLIAIDRTYRKQFGPMYARAKRFADEASTP
jgi:undecaprenyl-diphosphatase UppP